MAGNCGWQYSATTFLVDTPAEPLTNNIFRGGCFFADWSFPSARKHCWRVCGRGCGRGWADPAESKARTLLQTGRRIIIIIIMIIIITIILIIIKEHK